MDGEFIKKVVDEARESGANLVIWDRRDTFTIEHKDLDDLEVSDGYLRAKMQEGKATVYVDQDKIYKLVVEQDRSRRTGARAGFGAASG